MFDTTLKKGAATVAGALMAATVMTSSASAKVSIEWWYGNSGKIEEAILEMVGAFNASQDKYEVVGVRKGNYEETFAAMIAAYRTGQHPTIIQATERSFLTMLNSKAVIPVSKLMADKGYNIDWNTFIKPVADFYALDGAPAALPFNSSTAVLWYNADHFAAAGFDGPADTWDAFEKQLYALKEKGITQCGMTLNGDFPWSMIEGYSAINDYPFGTKANGFDGYDTEYVFNKTPVVKQVERIKRWIDDGVIQLAGQGMSPATLFNAGTCSTRFSSTASHADVEANATFKWGAAFMPHEADVKEPKNSNIGGAALWVLKGKKDQEYDAAAAFLDYVATVKNQVWWSKTTGYVPVTLPAYEAMKAEGFFKEHPTREIAILQLARGVPTENSRGFRFGNGNQSYQILHEELQSVWTGEKSVQQALDNAVARGNAVLRQYEKLHAHK